jgi:hypothetical protein
VRVTTFVRASSGVAGVLATLHLGLTMVAYLSNIYSLVFPRDLAYLVFVLTLPLLIVSSFALFLNSRWGVIGLMLSLCAPFAVAVLLTIVYPGSTDAWNAWWVVAEIGMLTLPALVGAFWPEWTAKHERLKTLGKRIVEDRRVSSGVLSRLLQKTRITMFVRVSSGVAGALGALCFGLVMLLLFFPWDAPRSVNFYDFDRWALWFWTFAVMTPLLIVSNFALFLNRPWGVAGLMISLGLPVAEAVVLMVVSSGAPDVQDAWWFVGAIGTLTLPSLVGAFWPKRSAKDERPETLGESEAWSGRS